MTGHLPSDPAQGDAELAALGPFFAIGRHDHAVPPAEGWRPLGELLDGGCVLAERIAHARAFLAAGSGSPPEAVELRVAASVTHLGLAARLLSPLLALAVIHGSAPRVAPAELRWHPQPGGSFPLSFPQAGPEGDARGLPFDEFARQLADAVGPFGVSRQILRGNTASALTGAARMLAGGLPERAAATHALTRELLGRPFLRGTLERAPGGAFRRRSCCLIYRAAPDRRGGLCGDCVLRGRRG